MKTNPISHWSIHFGAWIAPANPPRRIRSTGPRPDAGFSLPDLFAVLLIGAVLGALAASAGIVTKGRSDMAVCYLHLKRMTEAWSAYAFDHQGRLIGNMNGSDVMLMSNSSRTWALGWLDTSMGSPVGANTNLDLLAQSSPLSIYLNHDAQVFKCPADPSLSLNGLGPPRVRSISMNCYMGFHWTQGYQMFQNMSQFTDLPPAQAFVFLDEREDSINDGCFVLDMTGYDPRQPNRYQIVDFPADWHGQANNLSFVDGHVETWHWQDPRTMPPHQAQLSLGQTSPGNPDVARLQQAASRKMK